MNPLARRLKLRSWYRGQIPPGKSTPLSLLMIQPTRFCNIDCSYCYLPLRHEKTTINLDLLDPLLTKALNSGLIGDELTVLWHASEPLVLKPAFYEDAFARVERLIGQHTRVNHNFQTNAMLMSQDMCNLIRKHNITVGVSIDGPAHIHDMKRKTRSGKGTHGLAMKGIELLQRNKIPFSIIAVAGKAAFDDPAAFYEFFKNLSPRELGINIEEIEGHNAKSAIRQENSEHAFREFLKCMFDLSIRDNLSLRIREIDRLIQGFGLYWNTQEIFSSEANAFSILCMDVEGHLSTFSPEFVDVKNSEGKPLHFGHVQDIEFETIYNNETFISQQNEISAGIEMCRNECNFFQYCGGGAPINKLSENGSFSSSETAFCRHTKKIPIEIFEDSLIYKIIGRRTNTNGHKIGFQKQNASDVSQDFQGEPYLFIEKELFLRMRISAGTVPASTDPQQSNDYEASAIIPVSEWRDLTDDLKQNFVTREPKQQKPFISLVRFPGEIVSSLREQISKTPDNRARMTADTTSLQDAERWISQTLCYRQAPVQPSLGFARHPSGLITVTRNPLNGKRIGLHLDSWSRLPIYERETAPNRLSLNVGDQPRHLVFGAHGAKQIWQHMLMSKQINAQSGPTDIIREFLKTHPSYPIFTLEILPGEAYIAPTEDIIHDGSTLFSNDHDCSITWIGHFQG